MTHRPSGNARPDSSVAPNRSWTAPDGTLWRVWLEPPARHRIRQGETRPVLSFVEGGGSRRAVVRVDAGTALDELQESDLNTLLEEHS